MPTVKITGGKAGTSKGYTTTPTTKASSTISPLKPLASTSGNAPGGPQYASPSPTATAASTSGSGGSTTPPPSGLPANGSNPYTGWASQFSPGGLSGIWQDPQIALNQMYQDQGRSLSSPMYSTLRDFYGADPQSLYILMQGNKQGALDGGGFGNPGSYANFLNSLYGNQMTPGGRGISFSEILGNLSGVGDESGVNVKDQSPLYQMLTAGDASNQVRTLYGLLGDSAKASGMSPAIASAFMQAMAKQSDSYLANNATTQGGAVPYYQYFQDPRQNGQ